MKTAFSFIIFCAFSLPAFAGSIDFWNAPRKGANFFSNVPRKERFDDASKVGIVLARIAGNKWLNGRPESQLGNFLIGPKGEYSGIVEKDLKYLIPVLDDAHRSGLKVVFTMLSLPGSRWLQHNCENGKCKQQYDLWKDFKYHEQAAKFWRDLAKELKNHPAIIGYNIINEPCPERATSPPLRDWYTQDYSQWYQTVKGTPADLNLFYRTVIQAVREVDKDTPIVLDSGFYANPYALQILDPSFLKDEKLVYAIHHYEPSRFATSKNRGQYTYPGKIPSGELDIASDEDAQQPYAPFELWNRSKLDSYFKVVTEWMAQHHIPANRIYVAEFGAYRDADGVVDFLKDNFEFINKKGWHWSFYSYREDDGFPQMDYELGVGPTPGTYWECSKSYTCSGALVYKPKNPLWQVVLDALK